MPSERKSADILPDCGTSLELIPEFGGWGDARERGIGVALGVLCRETDPAMLLWYMITAEVGVAEARRRLERGITEEGRDIFREFGSPFPRYWAEELEIPTLLLSVEVTMMLCCSTPSKPPFCSTEN